MTTLRDVVQIVPMETLPTKDEWLLVDCQEREGLRKRHVGQVTLYVDVILTIFLILTNQKQQQSKQTSKQQQAADQHHCNHNSDEDLLYHAVVKKDRITIH